MLIWITGMDLMYHLKTLLLAVFLPLKELFTASWINSEWQVLHILNPISIHEPIHNISLGACATIHGGACKLILTHLNLFRSTSTYFGLVYLPDHVERGNACMSQWSKSSMLTYSQLKTTEQISCKFWSKYRQLQSGKCIWKVLH